MQDSDGHAKNEWQAAIRCAGGLKPWPMEAYWYSDVQSNWQAALAGGQRSPAGSPAAPASKMAPPCSLHQPHTSHFCMPRWMQLNSFSFLWPAGA